MLETRENNFGMFKYILEVKNTTRALSLKKVTKSVRWMPRLSEAKKDVQSCDKLRGGAKDR